MATSPYDVVVLCLVALTVIGVMKQDEGTTAGVSHDVSIPNSLFACPADIVSWVSSKPMCVNSPTGSCSTYQSEELIIPAPVEIRALGPCTLQPLALSIRVMPRDAPESHILVLA